MSSRSPGVLSRSDYKVACICPMGIELAPIEGMLDDIHNNAPIGRGGNAYTCGSIAGHNIVIAIMPEIGNNAAAAVITQLLNDFPSISFGLLTGIGAGVPTPMVDIRLGDVVVSQSSKASGGVVQYDSIKRLTNGKIELRGHLSEPPPILTSYVRKLESNHRRLGNEAWKHLEQMFKRYPKMRNEYSFPWKEQDLLFESSYPHQSNETCQLCDRGQVKPRPPRADSEPRIHYGIIGSGNAVIKDAVVRDELSREHGLICIEMEAAGLMNNFPCLVIRGICDYADSHKNKFWQPYAAAMAAAYFRELMMIIPPEQVVSRGLPEVGQTSGLGQGVNLNDAPDIDPDLFIGRHNEIEAMRIALEPSMIEQRRIALAGMGGVGKTQLSIAFAKRYGTLFESVFWLNAASEMALRRSFRDIAEVIFQTDKTRDIDSSPEASVSAVMRWLSQASNTRWLLIFDNYDEPDLFEIKKYYPKSMHGSLIITTRLEDAAPKCKVLRIQPLKDVGESVQIIASRSRRANAARDPHARRLAERLEGLPLALATVGACLRRTAWSFEEYQQEYEIRWNTDLRSPLQLEEYQDRTLYTTWDITYRRLQKVDADAAQMLKLLAFFGNRHISYHLFTNQATTVAMQCLDMPVDRGDFESRMGTLADCCLVEIQPELQCYSIHACVHDWLLVGLNKENDPDVYWSAFDCVSECIPDAVALEEHLKYAWLVGHVQRLVGERVMNAHWSEMTSHRCMCVINRFAHILHWLKLHDDAARALEKVLSKHESVFGGWNSITLSSLSQLGRLYRHQKRFQQAEETLQQALDRSVEHLGPEHRTTAFLVTDLADFYRRQGDFDKAETFYARAAQIFEKADGRESRRTMEAYGRLGNLHRKQGKMDQAEPAIRAALAATEAALGSDSYETSENLHDLGKLQEGQGKLTEALQSYNRAFPGYVRILGPDHSHVRRMMYATGELYIKTGQLKEAEGVLKPLLEADQRADGPQHYRTKATVKLLDKIARLRISDYPILEQQ